MKNENQQMQVEIVTELADTIQKKLVMPAVGKMDLISHQLDHIYKMIEGMERELALLHSAHNLTRVLAVASTIGLGVLIMVILFK